MVLNLKNEHRQIRRFLSVIQKENRIGKYENLGGG
jgi:hypothetical protein